MRNLIQFWKKDLINKFILLISLALGLSFLVVLYMVLSMPRDSLFSALFKQSRNQIPTMAAVWTETPIPTVTMVVFPSATRQPPTPTRTTFPTATPVPPTPTSTPEPPTALPSSATATLASAFAANCIPQSEPEIGKVVDIVDGNTIKVLIQGEVYTARYLGIQVPQVGDPTELYAPQSAYINGTLVFAKEIRLFKDVTDKDNMGRLLRYVMQGETFINFELIRTGNATALDTPPDSACASVFQEAEQSARQALLGLWKYAPTASVP